MKNRKRNRMLGYDYSQNNLYFVTICVQDRECCFGAIVGTGRDLSVHDQNSVHNQNSAHDQNSVHNQNSVHDQNYLGDQNSVHNQNSVHDQNSMHDKNPANSQNPAKDRNCSQNAITKIMQRNQFGTIAHDRLEWLENQYKYVFLHSYIVMPNHVHAIIEIDSGRTSDYSIKIKSLSELIGAYKTTSSKQIHLAGFSGFAWQRSFHDHIIRNDASYTRISNYIETNQERWNTDTFFEK